MSFKEAQTFHRAQESMPPREAVHKEQVRRHFVGKLRYGEVGNLLRIVLSDPETREEFQALQADKAVFAKAGGDHADITAIIVTLMRDERLAPVAVETMLRQMRHESERLKELIDEALVKVQDGRAMMSKEREALVWDEVIVGGGIHASIYNMARTTADPTIKSLTIEATDTISANFRTKGYLQANSPNTEDVGKAPNLHLRKGNQNYFGKHAPVQVPYLTAERYPSARLFADVATANQYLSSSKILMNDQVQHVILPERDKNSKHWPAKYKVKLESGRTIFANSVIFGTGYGEAVYPKDFDEESMRLVDEARMEVRGTDRPAGIMTYEDFSRYQTNSDTPFREFAGKKIDVGGGGDSAATVMQFLLRLAKKEAYKKDTAQVGDVASVHWVGLNAATREEYLRALGNDRYGDIAAEMPDPGDERLGDLVEKKKIHPISGYIVQVHKSDKPELGRYKVIYELRSGGIKESYTDYVILATGYQGGDSQGLGRGVEPVWG